MRRSIVVPLMVCAFALAASTVPRAQDGAAVRRTGLDSLLDLYVRDGLVYYRALKHDRAKLDEYLSGAANTPVETLPKEEQLAFWLNAYNATVLRTVIDHYPISGRSTLYPPHSLRQVPGAFDRMKHRLGGRSVTLDEIEKTILPTFNDPRVYFALGRGSVGGGRLRSEAFVPARLDAQLADVRRECVQRPQCWLEDTSGNLVQVSSIFSWQADQFVSAYAAEAPAPFANRSPIERAVLAYVAPQMLTTEREFLDRDSFKMAFKPFDWTLNDLTGRSR
jgi:hypothetical protein